MMIWLVVLVVTLWSNRTIYNIRALGLSVARITIDHDKDKRVIKVEANSLINNRLFPRLDNVYLINYEGAYLPRKYTRHVKQNNVDDTVVVTYDRINRVATQTNRAAGSVLTYPIRSDLRDFFSLFTYLCETQGNGGIYYIDGNSSLWQATVELIGRDQIESKSGNYQTKHYEMRFRNLSGFKPPYIDMITFNTLNESNVVNFWVNAEGIPVKAIVKKNLISMTWEMVTHIP